MIHEHSMRTAIYIQMLNLETVTQRQLASHGDTGHIWGFNKPQVSCKFFPQGKVALGIFGQCNAQASNITHCVPRSKADLQCSFNS